MRNNQLPHRGPQVLLQSQLHHRGHRVLNHRDTRVLHHNLHCSSLLHRGSQALHHQRTGYATTYAPPADYTESPKYYSAPAYYTEVLNTTLLPAKYPQLRRPSIMQYLLTTQRLLHRTTLIRITTPRFQFISPKSTLSPSCYTEAPVYCNTKAPEYYTTAYASPAYYTEALKYYSAPSYNTTKTSDYYITSQPMLLQPLCNLKLIFNENKFFNASNYLVRL